MRPNINWQQVWRNLHNSWVSEEIRSVWYIVIHDILPTNTGLAAITMVETRLQEMWEIGHPATPSNGMCGGCCHMGLDSKMTGSNVTYGPPPYPRYMDPISPILFLAPAATASVLWTLAHLVWYCLQGQRRQSILDYIDFLRRSRWKAYQRPHRLQRIGNYLDVL